MAQVAARPVSGTVTFHGGERDAPRLALSLPPRWEPVAVLGVGGQADVWLAEDRELGERVAIKVFRDGISTTQRERLRQEVKLGRSLSHPGLVRVFELIEAGERPAVAMEWIEGGSLSARIAEGALPVEDVEDIARQVLEVLVYLHARDIVHRDVKPSNLLVDRGGRIRLADLGLVRVLTSDSDLTRTAVAVGTPGYMSPEQIRGLPPTPATDLYSLGVTLFHLLTGRAPFSGSSEFDVATQHLRAAVPDPRRSRVDCPPWLARFVVRLLEKRPSDRFPDAVAALDALRRHRTAVSPRRVRLLAFGLIGVASTAALLGAAFSAWRGLPARAEVVGHTVVVSDHRGHELWRRALDGVPFGALLLNVQGGREKRVAVAVDRDVERLDRGRPMMILFNARGSELARDDEIADRLGARFRQAAAARFRAFRAEDLDGDGDDELVWLAAHAFEYPSELGVWMPSRGLKPSPLLSNSGHLHEVTAADLNGDGVKELVVVGLNNPLGFQLVLAVAPTERNGQLPGLLAWVSPDQTDVWCRAALDVSATSRVAYVPLGPYRATGRVLAAGPAGITVDNGGSRVVLDAAGNPAGSPLFGGGMERRWRFWVDLADTCTGVREGGAAPVAMVERFLASYPDVLQERGSRIAAQLLLTRALARAGDHAHAVRMLREAATADSGVSDYWLHLGEQQFMAGERNEALETLSIAATPRAGGRPRAQASMIQGVAVALVGGPADRWKTLDTLQQMGEDMGALGAVNEVRAIRSFATDDTSAPSLDRAVKTYNLPTVPVAKLWAALRGGLPPAAVEDGLRADVENPQTHDAGNLLRAEIHRLGGDLDRAAALAEESLRSLRIAGRTSLEAYFWCALAEHEVGRILQDQGHVTAARAHFRRAAEMAPGCWFGGRAGLPRAAAER